MIANKYLLFVDGADAAACYPAANLISMTCAANATLLLHFKSNVGDVGDEDVVTLTITADKEAHVMSIIAKEITLSGYGLIEIANDVTSTYLIPEITACSIALDT